jgi:Arc/MetJ family transcription regulator
MCDFMTEDQLTFYKGQIERQIVELEERLNSQASQAIATNIQSKNISKSLKNTIKWHFLTLS